MPETTNIESKYSDRTITVKDSYGDKRVAVVNNATKREEFAFINPQGARDLIDALEPFATPKPLPGDDINWGPQIGGSEEVYQQVNERNVPEGTRVRITRPGETPVVSTVKWIGGIPGASVDGERIHFRDRANGYPGHNWLLEFEQPKAPSLYDQYLELAPGTRFRTAGFVTGIVFTKISDDKVVREWHGEARIYGFEQGDGGFSHWKTTSSTTLEVL